MRPDPIPAWPWSDILQLRKHALKHVPDFWSLSVREVLQIKSDPKTGSPMSRAQLNALQARYEQSSQTIAKDIPNE